MADSFTLDTPFVEWLIEGVTTATQEVKGTAEIEAFNQSQGMYVLLTELGPISGSADERDPAPYKAKTVVKDDGTGKWVDVDASSQIIFDPDDVSGDQNIIPEFVFSVNGAKDLIDTVQWISLHGLKVGTGNTFWAFRESVSAPELAITTGQGTPGTYTGNQIDEDFVVTGRVYNGIDLPILTCIAAPREHIPNGTQVVVVRKGDKALFEWKDPIVEMGPDASPQANANGEFDAFFDDTGAYGGNNYNFDPADGIFKHRRVIAIGSTSGSGSGGTAAGLKFTTIDDHNTKIELVDENGTVIPPTASPVTYCGAITYDRNTHQLTITTTDSNANQICTNFEIMSDYCSTPTFDPGTRILTTTSTDDQGNIICNPTVEIPCCDTSSTSIPTNPPGPPVTPYPPTNYPPNAPNDPVDPNIVYTDPCTPPIVTCKALDKLCYPVSANSTISQLDVQTNNTTGSFQIDFGFVVKDPNGADISNAAVFELNTAAGGTGDKCTYKGGIDLKAGVYTFTWTVTNDSSDPNCTWPNFTVSCMREVIECECNDDDSTEDGTGTDHCDLTSSAYCDGFETIESSSGLCVINKNRNVVNTGRQGTITVQMDIEYSPYLGGQTQLQKGPVEDPQINNNPPRTIYRKRARLTRTFTFDPDQTWRETVTIPVTRQDQGRTATAGRTGTSTRNGRLELSYSSFNESVIAKYIDGFSFSISPNAKEGQPGVWMADNGIQGNGSLTVTVDISDDPSDNPLEENYVGDVEIKSQCCRQATFEITGGAQQALFYLVNNGTSASIYVQNNANTALALYGLEITATCTDSGLTVTCEDTILLSIAACDALEELSTIQTTGTGIQGQPVATVQAGATGGVLQADNGRQNTRWAVVENSVVDAPTTLTDREFFTVESRPNGIADIIPNADLPEGAYRVKLQAQNMQMQVNDSVMEFEVDITVDRTSTYKPSIMKELT
ncbi:MAG TPA: hypothetical protein EYN51_01170 [Flavobacteriales bacterium]|nr:hypothetical protein [Flavobacteriales bacterium]